MRWDFDFAEFEAELWAEFRGSKVMDQEPGVNERRYDDVVYPSDIVAWCASRGVTGLSVEFVRGIANLRPRRG
jgi:hypothetical protein